MKGRFLAGLAGIVLAAGMSPQAVEAADFPVYVCGEESRIEQITPKTAHAKSLKSEETFFPMKHEGTVRIIYTLVDTVGNPYPLTQEETDELMRNTEFYYERMFRGEVDIELTRAGRVYIPIDNTEVCEWSDPFDWAELVDAQVDGSLDLDGNSIDLFKFDDRVYFHSGNHACPYGGLATIQGNLDLPIYTGGFANQAFIFNERSEFTVSHEIGHNWGFGHANQMENATQPYVEYGDNSSPMGWVNWNNPHSLRELRGLHAINRKFLGQITPSIALKEANYRIYAEELENPSGEQLLVIPHPEWDDAAFYLSYRRGGDGTDHLGNPAPLDPFYTQGVSIHFSAYGPRSQTTQLETVLADGEVRLGNAYETNGFFTVQQIEHDNESVLIELDFHPRWDHESINAYNCHNGYDDDGDGKMDFGGGDGMPPEGPICAFPFDSMVYQDRAQLGDEFRIRCHSEYDQMDGFGPQGPGLVTTERTSDGWYTSYFAPEHCGMVTVECGSSIPGTTMLKTLTHDVEIYCPDGQQCQPSGECLAPRIRRPTSGRVKPQGPHQPPYQP